MLEDIRRVQLIEIEILREFVRICKKNNLQYFLAYGTLLGAIRHQGFIPWDDDIDIVMPRSDYYKLSVIIEQELGEKFLFQNNNTDSNYPDSMARIRKKNTQYADEWMLRFQYISYGCWIDIYPLDNITSKSLAKIQWILGKKIVNRIAVYRTIRDVKGIHWVKKFLHYFALIIPMKILLILRDAIFQMQKDEHSQYLANFTSPYSFRKDVVERDKYGNGVELLFEGIKCKVPEKWDEILQLLYGNYMKLPPENERRIYHNPKLWTIN